MFEYLESVAKDIVDELNKCAAQMETGGPHPTGHRSKGP